LLNNIKYLEFLNKLIVIKTIVIKSENIKKK